MNILLCLACVLAAVTAYYITYLYLRGRNSFLRMLQGPESPSFLLGNESQLRYQNEVGEHEYKWMRQYGTAWRRTGPLGVNYLSVADPKALQYILHTSGYHFPKGKEVTQVIKLLLGQGVVWAHGTTHQRQRKIMTPAFSAPQLRTFLPLFQDMASKLVQKWTDEVISPDPTGQPLINVTPLAFAHNPGHHCTLYPSRLDVVFKALWHYIPQPILHFVRYLPSREYRRFRSYSDYMRGFARGLIKESIVKGDGKDVMSVLLRANLSSDLNSKMSEDEIIDQISTLLLAGHDTTSNTMTWFLWELSKHPESQDRIRAEIEAVRAQNGEDLSPANLDSMVYTQAALKESMRLHPIIWILRRIAERDDVIPLAFPITTRSGEKVSSIPVRKGTPIDILIGAYNRLPEIWGQDADEWNPDRFLNIDKTKQATVGLFANFILEIQVITTMLLENFAFSLPPQSEKTRIYRKPGGVMIPMAESKQGSWMGLIVKALK
ncbi:cytochrome P450 [Lactarius hatsudake]|nr:cytochrome P450 [Lactarius hatsudake]